MLRVRAARLGRRRLDAAGQVARSLGHPPSHLLGDIVRRGEVEALLATIMVGDRGHHGARRGGDLARTGALQPLQAELANRDVEESLLDHRRRPSSFERTRQALLLESRRSPLHRRRLDWFPTKNQAATVSFAVTAAAARGAGLENSTPSSTDPNFSGSRSLA